MHKQYLITMAMVSQLIAIWKHIKKNYDRVPIT